MKFVYAVVSIALFPLTALAGEEPIRCLGTGIGVPNWNAEERDRICSAAAAVIAFFRAAGLPIMRMT